jgi:hypothetical protein
MHVMVIVAVSGLYRYLTNLELPVLALPARGTMGMIDMTGTITTAKLIIMSNTKC